MENTNVIIISIAIQNQEVNMVNQNWSPFIS